VPAIRTVYLINPPSAPGTLANREGAAGLGVVYPSPGPFFYPPHALASVAASLRTAGYDVRAHDALVEQPSADWALADAIGVFVSHASLESDLAFLSMLRGMTSAWLIAFGPSMRYVADAVLTQGSVDIVLVGEAEGFFEEALRSLETAERPSLPQLTCPADVQALNFDGHGMVRDLDALPFPAWDLLPYSKYPLLTVLSSRGCPDPCVYCPYTAAQGHGFRARSLENVLAELEYVSERFRPTRLVFRDPVFAHDRLRVVRLCRELVDRQLGLQWECESRPEHFDAELLEWMQRAGCRWVKIGLETTDQDLLVALHRVASAEAAGAYLQHTAEIVAICRKMGLRSRLFVMAGLPGQNAAMAEATRSFIERVRPTALNVKLCEVYPGTHLPMGTAVDHARQLQILRQAQAETQATATAPRLSTRAKRWLKRIAYGGRDG